MVHVQAGKEFPDMRQKERRIKFNRVGKPNSGLVQGRAKPFCRLVASFYSLKTEKIPTGMVALGDWLGCYRAYNRVGLYLILGQRTGMFRSRSSWQQLL